MKIFKEFKKFISRGNVIDLAVGMIIGAAFTAIVTAIVNNIFQPLISLIPISELGFKTVLREAYINAEGVTVPAAVIDWSAVISAIISFIITAIILFAIIYTINILRDDAKKLDKIFRKNKNGAKCETTEGEAATPEQPEPVPLTVEELLAQILCELKSQKSGNILNVESKSDDVTAKSDLDVEPQA